MKLPKDKILIEPIKDDKIGNIYVSEGKRFKGKIIAIGSEVTEANVGDIAVYTEYGPIEVKINIGEGDKSYFVAKEEDILIYL
jgi:putative component of toxin-antitoxin plasmid stabilization module